MQLSYEFVRAQYSNTIKKYVTEHNPMVKYILLTNQLILFSIKTKIGIIHLEYGTMVVTILYIPSYSDNYG